MKILVLLIDVITGYYVIIMSALFTIYIVF